MIKIAIADDHPLVISGLKSILPLYPHIIITATYPDGDSLLKGFQADQPDVLLLDIQLPDKTGEELAPVLLKKYPDLKILTLTNFNSTLYANNMFAHGVHGYILKSTDNETLIHAIEAVHRGEHFIDEAMREKMNHITLRIDKRRSLKSTLTLREKQILQLIVNGDTSSEIAEKLFLSINTVDTYRNAIMLKMDAKNVAQLVKMALKMGISE